MECPRFILPRHQIRWRATGLPASALCLVMLAACGSVTAASKPSPVVGDGFRLTLPAGWTSSAPAQDSGFTTVAVQTPTGEPTITVATLPIPNEPSNPQITAFMDEDITTIALTINGTEGVQPTLTEAAHLVNFVGESCARVGLSSGSSEDGRVITCRRGRIIYDISVSGTSPDSQLLSTLNDIASGWSWT